MTPKAARRFLRRNAIKAARSMVFTRRFGITLHQSFWRRWKEATRILIRQEVIK